MCATAMRRMVSLSGFLARAEQVGTMSLSSAMQAVILLRRRLSISQWFSLWRDRQRQGLRGGRENDMGLCLILGNLEPQGEQKTTSVMFGIGNKVLWVTRQQRVIMYVWPRQQRVSGAQQIVSLLLTKTPATPHCHYYAHTPIHTRIHTHTLD